MNHLEQLEQLENELIRAKQVRGLLGKTENGIRRPWTGMDDEIRQLQDMIWEIKLENGMVAVFPDDDF